MKIIKKFSLELVVDLLLFFLSFYIYVYILKSRLNNIGNLKMGLTAAFFPSIIAISLILLTLGLLVRNLINKINLKNDKNHLDLKNIQVKQLISVILLIFFYIISIDLIGYYISSFLLLIILMHFILKLRNWIELILISFGLLFVIFLFFQKLLNVWLPTGLLF